MPQRIIAVEIAGERVRAAAASRTWNGFEFIGVFEAQRGPDEPDLAPALMRLIAKTGRPDILISALPSELVTKRILELPFSDARRLHQVVPFALEEHLPFPVDGAVVAFVRLGVDHDHSLVLAAFARKQELHTHLDLLKRAGLDPKTVTLAPYALATMFARARNGARPTPHLVVEAEHDSTSIVLLDKDSIPRVIRTVGEGLVNAGGAQPTAAQTAAVVNALRQTILAHATELEDADLIVTGPGGAMPAVKALLAEAAALVAREAHEFDCSAMFEGTRPDITRFGSAIAMLLGELPAKPVDMLNFRQADFAFHGRTRGDLTPFYTPAILAVCVAFLIALNFASAMIGKLHRVHVLNAEIAAVAAPVLGESNPADPMRELHSGIAAMNKRLLLIGGNMARNSPLETLRAISEAVPPRIPVQMEDLQVDASGLRISGIADSFAAVDEVKHALDQSGDFGTIEVTHAGAGANTSKVEFRMSANFKDSEAGAD
ncbi:MAG TPA: type II secretion system protein GspL [Candidatus Binataceae bacterium]|nr:type II secretion system protein GspL [Candidatus Binataceae bacterium]